VGGELYQIFIALPFGPFEALMSTTMPDAQELKRLMEKENVSFLLTN
jgi:hypothetical protein